MADRLDGPAFDGAKVVLASPEVDAMLIAASLHADLPEAAVAAGTPVPCCSRNVSTAVGALSGAIVVSRSMPL